MYIFWHCHPYFILPFIKLFFILVTNNNEGPRTIVGYPQIKCGELSKKPENGLKIIHCTLPSYWSFRNVNYLQLMKYILNVIFSRFGGLIQHLWASPLWFSALQLWYPIYNIGGKSLISAFLGWDRHHNYSWPSGDLGMHSKCSLQLDLAPLIIRGYWVTSFPGSPPPLYFIRAILFMRKKHNNFA